MRFFRDAPRWLLLAALFYAPWDYGGTTERGIITLNWLLGTTLALWIIGSVLLFVFRREWPARVPWLLAVLCLLLLITGWWMVLNAKAIYDSEHYLFVAVRSVLPSAPGSVDRAVSTAWMIRATTLLGTVCMVADLFRNPRWLLRIWSVMGAAGGSIAFLGLVQKASGAKMIFWRAVDQPVETFFATFFYHGNAGAFLNLTLPLTIGLAVRACTRPSRSFVRALWLTMAIVSMVAAFSNTSRMGQVLAALLLIALAAAFSRQTWGAVRGSGWATAGMGVLALILAAAIVSQTSRVDRSWKRWEEITRTIPQDARWIVPGIAVRALPEAGWMGFGPGTFHVIFPYYTAASDRGVSGFWFHLHQDYLQTLLEWGWWGGGLWALLSFGGMMTGLRSRMAAGESWSPRQRLLSALLLLALGSVALHALVDFPLQVASIQTYAAAYLGLCWGSSRWAEGAERGGGSEGVAP